MEFVGILEGAGGLAGCWKFPEVRLEGGVSCTWLRTVLGVIFDCPCMCAGVG